MCIQSRFYTKMLDVSIIIPCYLQHSYVLNAVNSCLQQSVLPKDIIVILMDEQSKQLKSTLEQLSTIVRCFKTERMLLPAARNFGIKQSSSSYILPLDADDWIEQNFLEKIARCINSAIDIVYSDYIIYREQEQVRRIVPNTVLKVSFLNKKHPFILATTLFTKQMWKDVGGYNEDFIYGFENWEFFYRAFLFEKKFVKCNDAVFYYRHGNNNINGTRANNHKSLIEQQFRDFYPADFEIKVNKQKQPLIRLNFVVGE